MGSFTEKLIEIAIKLAANPQTNQPIRFQDGSSSVTLKGFRTSVRVMNATGIAGNEATVTIYGLPPALMLQLSTLGMVLNLVPGNTITITAGDSNGMSTVFTGNIYEAYGEYDKAPDVPMVLKCRAGSVEAVIPFPVTSYNGKTDVATILSYICQQQFPFPWGFENNGVTTAIQSPYLSGSAKEQIDKIAKAARIRYALLPGSSVQQTYILAIWPRYGSRNGGGTPLVAPPPDGQMIGYPNFTQQGIVLNNVFDTRFALGIQIKVQSSIFTTQSLTRIGNVQSLWSIWRIDLALDSLIPNGAWTSTLYGYNPGTSAPLVIPPR